MTDCTFAPDCHLEECVADGCLITRGLRRPAPDLIPSHLQPHAFDCRSRQAGLCDCVLSLPASPTPAQLADEADRVHRIGNTRVDRVTPDDQDFYWPHPLRSVPSLHLPTIARWLRTKETQTP